METQYELVALFGESEQVKNQFLQLLRSRPEWREPEEHGPFSSKPSLTLELPQQQKRLVFSFLELPPHISPSLFMQAWGSRIGVLISDPQVEKSFDLKTWWPLLQAWGECSWIRVVWGKEKNLLSQKRGGESDEQLPSKHLLSTLWAVPSEPEKTWQMFSQHLIQAAESLPPSTELGKPRLVITGSSFSGFQEWKVEGPLTGGILHQDQVVALEPEVGKARIFQINQEGEQKKYAEPIDWVTLTLKETKGHRLTQHAQELKPGMILTGEVLGGSSDTVDLLLHEISDKEKTSALEANQRVQVVHGKAIYPGRLLLLNQKALQPGEKILAELRLGKKAPFWVGDRVVLFDSRQERLLAWGIVLDAEADRRRWRTPEQTEFLLRRAASPNSAEVFLETQILRDGMIRLSHTLRRSHFSETALEEAAQNLQRKGKVVAIQGLLVTPRHWQKLRQKAARLIDEFHRTKPMEPGFPLQALRGKLGSEVALPGVFEALIQDLCREGFSIRAEVIRRSDHALRLPDPLRSHGDRIRMTLKIGGLNPPSRKEIAPDRPSIQALRYLLSAGEAVALSAEVVLSAQAYREAVERIVRYLLDHEKATVHELREAVGTSRRVILPLLEKLDQEGVTVRDRNVRRLGPKSKKWIDPLDFAKKENVR